MIGRASRSGPCARFSCGSRRQCRPCVWHLSHAVFVPETARWRVGCMDLAPAWCRSNNVDMRRLERSAMRDFRFQRHRTRLHALCMSSVYGRTFMGCEKVCRLQHATWCHNALPRHCSNTPTIPVVPAQYGDKSTVIPCLFNCIAGASVRICLAQYRSTGTDVGTWSEDPRLQIRLLPAVLLPPPQYGADSLVGSVPPCSWARTIP
jgi:hypothetical protein